MEADPGNQVVERLQAENEQLRAENNELRGENNKLREMIRSLQDRIQELQRQVARQAAPFRRKDKDRKPPSDHGRPGRPKGHAPAYRPKPAHIDQTLMVPLAACPHCGGKVSGVSTCEQFIEDLPAPRPHVTRLVTYRGTCARCGDVRSTHPLQVSTATGAAQTHLGPRALAVAAMLSKQGKLTTRSACHVLKQMGGLHLTPGGLVQAMHRVARKLNDCYEQLIEGLRQQPAVHSDETSWWLGGRGSWLWVFTTPERTVYRVEDSRGKDVVVQTLGVDFQGTVVTDCLASYENLPYRMQKCYAHHLKAIAEAAEGKPPKERAFLDELAGLLKAAMTLGRMRQDLPPPDFAQARQRLECRADDLLGPQRSDPEEQRVVNRLRKRRQWLFTFLDYPEVEPTNNRAERALRPAVISRKLSCGNKTSRGKRTWEVLASLAATCRQRDEDFVQWIRPTLALAAEAPAR